MSINNEYTILCGDWNLVIDPSLDYEYYSQINNPSARQIIIRMIQVLDYVDIWQEMNENVRGFTWRRFNPSRKQSCHDYFLIIYAQILLILLQNPIIIPGYRSDH